MGRRRALPGRGSFGLAAGGAKSPSRTHRAKLAAGSRAIAATARSCAAAGRVFPLGRHAARPRSRVVPLPHHVRAVDDAGRHGDAGGRARVDWNRRPDRVDVARAVAGRVAPRPRARVRGRSRRGVVVRGFSAHVGGADCGVAANGLARVRADGSGVDRLRRALHVYRRRARASPAREHADSRIRGAVEHRGQHVRPSRRHLRAVAPRRRRRRVLRGGDRVRGARRDRRRRRLESRRPAPARKPRRRRCGARGLARALPARPHGTHVPSPASPRRTQPTDRPSSPPGKARPKRSC